MLRVWKKNISSFHIPASGHLWPILIHKVLEIAHYSCGFAQSNRPNPT